MMRNVGSELQTELILWHAVEVCGGSLEIILLVPQTLAFPVKFALSVDFRLTFVYVQLLTLRKWGRFTQTEIRFGGNEEHSLGVP